jgi:hypothetical protein
MEMSEAASAGRRRRNVILAVVFVVIALLIAGIGWVAWWLADNIDAPGPPPTGSGACSSADAVNLQFEFADGHTVQACTRDRPACPNHTYNVIEQGRGQITLSQFGLDNQLRSSSRRYILFIRFDAPLPAETIDQTLQFDPRGNSSGPPGSPSSDGTLGAAVVQITPRDPYADPYTTASGSLTVSSSHGVARGKIEGNFSAPSTVSPVRIVGTFACNH